MTGPLDTPLTAKDVPSALMRQTLLDRALVRPVQAQPVIRLLPWLNVVVIGGRSIMDRGREAILPVVDELRAAFDDHKLLILTGAGIRARHVLGVGLDLGLPTGALAGLAATEAEQNGHLLAALLAEHGVSYLPHHTVGRQLAAHLAASPAVVSNGYPPFGVFELPPAAGRIPAHRTDAGAFLIADAYGVRRTVYVKDVDGVFTADPHGTGAVGAGRAGAELRDKVSASELLRAGASLPIDRVVLELMGHAKHVTEIQIVNGLTRGTLTRALHGEPVGTVVHAG